MHETPKLHDRASKHKHKHKVARTHTSIGVYIKTIRLYHYVALVVMALFSSLELQSPLLVSYSYTS